MSEYNAERFIAENTNERRPSRRDYGGVILGNKHGVRMDVCTSCAGALQGGKEFSDLEVMGSSKQSTCEWCGSARA